MSEDKAKIRLKIGHMEIEYEGTSSFLQDDLFNLLEKIVSFQQEHKAAIPTEPPQTKMGGTSVPSSAAMLDHSTNTIATLLGAKSGTDLIIAAAACFTMVQGKDRFTRRELLAEMQTAASFFRATYRNNLSKYLDRLVKGDRLRLVGENTYAISAKEKQALEAKLAE